MRQGLTHLYTGEGKGKTTAALGLLLRAHGHGLCVVLAQFLKGRNTGELKAMENLSGVTVLRQNTDLGFYKFADNNIKAEIKIHNNAILHEAYRLACSGKIDLLVLDEICAAYTNDIIEKELADKLILNKPGNLELVLTGRNALQHFIDAADYVTEFVKHKHPYDKGTAAREGVEF